MLKGIPAILSPQMLKVLSEMGHGDEIVFADWNFPAASVAKNTLIRCDGLGICQLLEAVLKVFPLDSYVKSPAVLMSIVPGDNSQTDIWPKYRKIIENSDEKCGDFEFMERQAFYERAKTAFAVVATGETAPYANLILKKGVIRL